MAATQPIEDLRTAWDRIAPGFDAYVTDANMVLAERVLDRVELGVGVRLLDVAAGTGAVSIPAARRGAEVTAIDVSAAMADHLVRRARAEGLGNVTATVMDGENLEFDDDSFDITASQFGVMLFPNLTAGLREMVRVTVPGGTVLLVVFGGFPRDLEFLSFFLAAVQTVVPGFDGLPTDRPLPPFRLATRQAITEHLGEAGLTDVRIETIDHALPLRASVSSADLFAVIANSNPMGTALVDRLTTEQRADIGHVLDGMLRERATSEDPWLHNPVHVATGVPKRLG